MLVATEILEAAKAHVLANLANQAFAHIFQGGAKAVLGMGQGAQGIDVSRMVFGNQLGSGLCQSQETVVFGDEVGFAVDFQQGAGFAVHGGGHHAFSGDTGSGFAGFAAQLDAQQLFGFDQIAFGFGQGFLAFHHGGIGFGTQLGDHACSDSCHKYSSVSVQWVLFKRGCEKGATRAPCADSPGAIKLVHPPRRIRLGLQPQL